ncbi:MAG: glycosyltransferase family 2 protein [Bacteroidales bacterium]|nr:glycosyltransferase family 2 protein [Bacteroidales bacterium]
MNRLLVIIVTYQGMRWIRRCLDSVFSSSMPADVILIDNGSDDGCPEFVSANYPQVILTRQDKNLGFARANDIGLRYAIDHSYGYVYLLNQDAWVLPDTFERLAAAFGSGRWGLLSPLQMRPDLVTPDRRFKKHYHGTMQPSDAVQPVRFVMAAHWMLSRECLEAVGLFSPAFSHYGEDNNYCDRVRSHGFGVGVLPSAVAVHDRQDRKRTKEQRIYLNCQYSKVRLSDPGSSFLFQAVWQPLRQCLMSVRWLSLKPLKDIGRLVREYPSLKRWREESLRRGAFIDD